LFAQLGQLRIDLGGDVFAFRFQLEQDRDVGLGARQFLVGLENLIEALARLKNFLGILRVVPEAGIGDDVLARG
jgi:hypothetical protein